MKTENKIIIWFVVITLAMAVGGVLLFDSEQTKVNTKLSKPLLGEKMVNQGASHVLRGEEHLEYNSNPPTSGTHWGNVAGPGIKNKQVPDELVLHSMEHGAAVLWYRDDLIKSDVDKIKKAFTNASGKKIMIPRANLDVPVALASWGYLLKINQIDENKIIEFIETNNDRAPESAQI